MGVGGVGIWGLQPDKEMIDVEGRKATFSIVQPMRKQASVRSRSTKCMLMYRKEITHHVFPRAENLKLLVLALK